MNVIGIICEYNPFHNGHIYHINKIKEMFPDSIIIAVVSGNFTQRGIPSILSKEDKKILTQYGIDLIVELPSIYAIQSSDIFAEYSIKILNELKAEYIVFGSEENNIEKLIKNAKIQVNNKKYDLTVQKYLNSGINYPTALSKALEDLGGDIISSPNDLLGLSYIKTIIKNNYNIKPVLIKRTNNYNSKELTGKISSARSIREAICNHKNVKKYVPKDIYKILKLKKEINYFNYLKYKILIEQTNISKYLTVDEGLENRIVKVISECNDIETLINKVKTKRYTYNKLSRMFLHILLSITKEDIQKNKDLKYIQILSFNNIGQKYLNSIKKKTDITLITNTKYYNDLLLLQNKIDNIYNFLTKK